MDKIIRLQELYSELDKLKLSGEDVVAEIRAEINDIELQILKEEIFPKAMGELANLLSAIRCTVDFSFQYDGKGIIDYSFCKSNSMSLIRDKVEGHFSGTKVQPTKQIAREPRLSKRENNNIRIEVYSERSIAVYGDTKALSDQFKEHGGYFNPYLRGGAGWVFSKRREQEVREIIANAPSPSKRASVEYNKDIDASKTVSKLSPWEFKEYLENVDKLNGRGGYTTSSITVYTTATRSKYIRSKIEKYVSSGILYDLVDLSVLMKLMDDIMKDVAEKITSSSTLMAIKLYIQMLNDKGLLIQSDDI